MQNKKGNVAVIAVIVAVVAVTAGVIGWMFAKKSQAPAPQSVAIRQPAEPSVQTSPTQTTPAQQLATENVESFPIPEVGITVSFPQGYSLVRNKEVNRRGSFVAYDFRLAGDEQTLFLNELQFFSETSIRNFTKGCGKREMCFEGSYPTVSSYLKQKDAFMQKKSFAGYDLKRFGTRYWYVSDAKCSGDICTIREYTTFLGGTMFDVQIVMAADSMDDVRADALFSQFGIDEDQTRGIN